MRKYREYLTDAELDNLILEIEQNEMVSATPDLQEQILEALEQEAKVPDERNATDKVIEYKRYRFRVMTTVAAAVLVVFLFPKLESLQQQDTEVTQWLVKHEFLMKNRDETKEELSDSGRLAAMLSGVNIFADNSSWNLFKK